jgi:hypothetical protein
MISSSLVSLKARFFCVSLPFALLLLFVVGQFGQFDGDIIIYFILIIIFNDPLFLNSLFGGLIMD